MLVTFSTIVSELFLTVFSFSDLSEALEDDADPTKSAISAVASLAAAWPQLHQGQSMCPEICLY